MIRGCVIGAGIDLVENERMAQTLQRWGVRFKDRVFLPAEQAYCDAKAFPSNHYAGRFAVKEAVSKAFGTGVGPQIGWCDIEVIRNPETGAPSVRLTGKAQALSDQLGVATVLISLSHTHNYAIAHALLIAKPETC
ncbi:MAG: holo-ACP synthase [Kiritimatiellae bacterium]|nr:holo-ACP synthase [Kiritimatiellia bacterium]